MAKTSTMRKALSKLPLYAQLSAGCMPPAWDMKALAAKDPIGPLGESLLHRFMLAGRADLASEWMLYGGPMRADGKGCYPIHWLSAAGSAWRMEKMLGSVKDARAVFWPTSQKIDSLGRDPAGLMCLSSQLGPLAAYLECFPEAAGQVHLGIGGPLSLADALIACCASWSEPGSARAAPLASAVYAQAAPSRQVPELLSGPKGLWTQKLWDEAILALASDEQLARMEADAIAKVASPGQPKTRAPRI